MGLTLSANLLAGTAVSIVQVGDVVGAQFPEEDEIAIYIPNSGDILLCPRLQWHLLQGRLEPASELEGTLLGLGVLLA